MAERSQRYQPLVRLAAGGMATVFVGAAYGSLGFRQLVAIKRPHLHLLEDPAYRSELLSEARLASMLRHANVVDVRDIDADQKSVQLIMDYVEGASVSDLVVALAERNGALPVPISIRIVLDALAGLQAAHDLRDERGELVQLVHRDISPQNVLVGLDGVARVTDFGIAKYAQREMKSTTGDALKGKIAYMAPEYVKGEGFDRRVDVFAAGVLLWEMLAGRRLFRGEHEADTLRRVLFDAPAALTSPSVPAALDAVLQMALAKDPERRFQTAEAMASALESVMVSERLYAAPRAVAAEVSAICGETLALRRAKVQAALEDFLVSSSIPHDRSHVLSVTLPLAAPTEPTEPTRLATPRSKLLASAPNAATLPEAGHDLRPVIAETQVLEPSPGSPPTRSSRGWLGLGALALILVGVGVAWMREPTPHTPEPEPRPRPSAETTGAALLPSAEAPPTPANMPSAVAPPSTPTASSARSSAPANKPDKRPAPPKPSASIPNVPDNPY